MLTREFCKKAALLVLAAAAVAAQGCVGTSTLATPPASSARVEGPSAAERLEAANRLVRAGCLDCLLEAYREFGALGGQGDVGQQATEGAIRAASLIALRQRELGLIDSGYMAKAREIASTMSVSPASLLELVDVADALPFGSPSARPPGAAPEQRVMLQVSRDWLTAAEPPFGLAAHNELFGYVWLALACDAVNARSIRPDEALAGIDAMRTFPLIVFKYPRRRAIVETRPTCTACSPRSHGLAKSTTTWGSPR